jgi:hypothetical protein
MKKISRKLLEFLECPQHRVVSVMAEIDSQALASEVTLSGRQVIVCGCEPHVNGKFLISGYYFAEPGIVHQWGNPEIMRAHD